MKYQNFIWDYDGTLVDTYPAMADAFRACLLREGIECQAEEILSFLRRSMGETRDYYQNKFGLKDAFFSQYEEMRTASEEKNAKPFDGVESVCRSIDGKGGRNFVFTHRGQSTIAFLEFFHLAHFFTDFVTSDLKFERKPSPEGIQHLISKYSLSPEETIMIGDREIDILAGKGAGVHTCLFSPGNAVAVGADYTISSYSQFDGLFLEDWKRN